MYNTLFQYVVLNILFNFSTIYYYKHSNYKFDIVFKMFTRILIMYLQRSKSLSSYCLRLYDVCNCARLIPFLSVFNFYVFPTKCISCVNSGT